MPLTTGSRRGNICPTPSMLAVRERAGRAVLRLCGEDGAVVLARRSVLGRRSELADSDTVDGIRRRNGLLRHLVIAVSAGENHPVAMLGL